MFNLQPCLFIALLVENLKVISLPQREDRRLHTTLQLTSQGIDFEFVSPAIPLPSKIGGGNSSLVHTTYRIVKEAAGKNEGVTIFEDDLILTQKFLYKAYSIMEQLPEDWDMLYFTGQVFHNWHSMTNTELHPYSKNLLKPKFLLGTQGYTLSPKGVKKLNFFLAEKIKNLDKPIDVLLGYDFILKNTVFVCKPFLMKEALLGSDISVEWDKSFTYSLYEDGEDI